MEWEKSKTYKLLIPERISRKFDYCPYMSTKWLMSKKYIIKIAIDNQWFGAPITKVFFGFLFVCLLLVFFWWGGGG